MIRSTVFVALLASIAVHTSLAAPRAAPDSVQSVIFAEETGRFLALSASGKVSANADMSKHYSELATYTNPSSDYVLSSYIASWMNILA